MASQTWPNTCRTFGLRKPSRQHSANHWLHQLQLQKFQPETILQNELATTQSMQFRAPRRDRETDTYLAHRSCMLPHCISDLLETGFKIEKVLRGQDGVSYGSTLTRTKETLCQFRRPLELLRTPRCLRLPGYPRPPRCSEGARSMLDKLRRTGPTLPPRPSQPRFPNWRISPSLSVIYVVRAAPSHRATDT